MVVSILIIDFLLLFQYTTCHVLTFANDLIYVILEADLVAANVCGYGKVFVRCADGVNERRTRLVAYIVKDYVYFV